MKNKIGEKYIRYKINKKSPIINTKTEIIYKLDFGIYLLSFRDTIDNMGKIKRSAEDKAKTLIFLLTKGEDILEKKLLLEKEIIEIDGVMGVLINSLKAYENVEKKYRASLQF